MKSCKIAGVTQIGPRPGSLEFAGGNRGFGVVATGGSDGVLRLIRGGQIEDEAPTDVSITALETSLCGRHVFVSLVDGVIIARHVIAESEEEDDEAANGKGRGGGGGGGGGVGVVSLHSQSRELRLPRHGVAITCMRLSPDGASLICGASSGAVYIARVRTVINGLVHEPAALPPVANTAKPLAMVPLEDLRDRNAAIAKLEEKLAHTVESAKFRAMMLEDSVAETAGVTHLTLFLFTTQFHAPCTFYFYFPAASIRRCFFSKSSLPTLNDYKPLKYKVDQEIE